MWRMLTARAGTCASSCPSTTPTAERHRTLDRPLHVHADRPPGGQRRAGPFRFADGLIAEHVDEFSFWKWSRQALGPAGLALGWTPVLRTKVGDQARAGLQEYMAAPTGVA